MKKLLIFFLLIHIINCSSINIQKEDVAIIDCPNVYFSSENRTYVDSNLENTDLNMLSYKATLNNYGFVNECTLDAKNSNIDLEILIITEPINPTDEIINLPIFVLLYDSQNNLIGKQYFRKTSILKYDSELSNYVTTDVTAELNIFSELEIKISSIIIGFAKVINSS